MKLSGVGVGRYDGITLEFSNKKGIIIQSAESRKRVYCAKFGTVKAFRGAFITDALIHEYEQYLHIIDSILSGAFEKYNFIVTGEEYRKNCRFIACSILRTRAGYLREVENKDLSINQITLSIAGCIEKELDYTLSVGELHDVQSLLEESNVLFIDDYSSPEISQEINILEEKIQALLGLPKGAIFSDKVLLEQYISKMYLRFDGGNVAVNHYNEDIVTKYPLESHLMYRFFPDVFKYENNKRTFLHVAISGIGTR